MAPRISVFFLTVLATLILLSTIASAASPTSFCKCTCGTNSTIIALRFEPASPPPTPLADNETSAEQPPRKTGTCADCNRQFCLENRVDSLPICKASSENEIFTKCFQRDSAKDEAVIYSFIFLTVGLLVYAVIRPWLQKRMEERRYSAVSSGQGG